MKKFIMPMARAIALGAAVFACFAASAQTPAALPKLNITVFESPSQSIWIPTLIQALQLDRKHGFELQVTPKPSKVAYTDFASGADPVCYCNAIAAVARFKQQGSDITLLWNIFDFGAYVLTNNPEIRTIKDLEGHTLQTDTISGNWVLTNWFLRAQGVDLSKVQIRSQTSSVASVAELQLKRIDSVGLNPTEASAAKLRTKGQLRAIDVVSPAAWKQATGTEQIPAIALGVWRSWYAKPENQDLARRFYAANKEAEAYIRSHPDDAAARVAGPAKIEKAILQDVFANYTKLIDIRPMSDYRNTVAVLTQKLLPESKQLPRPLTDAELKDFVSDFKP